MSDQKKDFIKHLRIKFERKTLLTLGAIKKEIKKSIKQENIIKLDSPVWIFGKSGKGKTLTALRMAWRIYEGEGSSENGAYSSKPLFNCWELTAYMSYDLCRAFQSASLNNEEYEPRENCLYVIDDIDKIKMTDFREEQLFRFFDICLKRNIRLIITSQLSIQDFASMFSGSFVVAIERRLSSIFKEVEL